jgi:hypothetical protein
MRKDKPRGTVPEPVEVPVYFSATAQWVARVEQEANRRKQGFGEFIRESAERALSSRETRKSGRKPVVG